MSIYEKKEVAPFSYCKRGCTWAVYDNSNGSKIDEFINVEEARRKTYELNGWIYTPKSAK